MCCAVLHNMAIVWSDQIDEIETVIDFRPPHDHIDEYEVFLATLQCTYVLSRTGKFSLDWIRMLGGEGARKYETF